MKKNKRLKFLLPVLLILGLVLTSACAPAAVGPLPSPPPLPSFPKDGQAPKYEGDRETTSVPGGGTVERKIVRTGQITLEVEDIANALDDVATLASQLGGYVVSSHKYVHEGKTSGSIAIRIPVNRFDEAFDKLRDLGISVPYENTQARDVTEEYVDLEARLRNLEATEAQYLALLEKAEEVEDMLKVQRELSNVREAIERIEGQMKYLERTSEMALIEVSLEETKSLVAPWSASGAAKSAVRGLTAFGRGLATVIIWLGVFCWIWVPPLIIWLRRRRRAKG